MGRNRFVEPETKRINISDGDWIEIKKELNSGDTKRYDAAGISRPMFSNGRVINPIDWKEYDFERLMVWLTDWSLVDAEGKSVELSISSLKAVDSDTLDEIDKAVQVHAVEVAEAKKSRAAARAKTASPSTPTPPSEPKTDDAQTSQS